jgi:putative oxidoreductase
MSSVTEQTQGRAPERLSGPLGSLASTVRRAIAWLDSVGPKFEPFFDLAVRVGIAWIFWKSGLTKIASWDTTVLLFTHEYSVPLLSPAVAAFLGTAAELTLPVLLAFGIAGRFAALALFIFNIMAVVSYPALNIYGKLDHLWWGCLMLITLFRGPGRWSVDHFVRKAFWDRA